MSNLSPSKKITPKLSFTYKVDQISAAHRLFRELNELELYVFSLRWQVTSLTYNHDHAFCLEARTSSGVLPSMMRRKHARSTAAFAPHWSPKMLLLSLWLLFLLLLLLLFVQVSLRSPNIYIRFCKWVPRPVTPELWPAIHTECVGRSDVSFLQVHSTTPFFLLPSDSKNVL